MWQMLGQSAMTLAAALLVTQQSPVQTVNGLTTLNSLAIPTVAACETKMAAGNATQAERCFRAALRQFPENVLLYIDLAECLVAANKSEMAREEFQEGIDLYEKLPVVRVSFSVGRYLDRLAERKLWKQIGDGCTRLKSVGLSDSCSALLLTLLSENELDGALAVYRTDPPFRGAFDLDLLKRLFHAGRESDAQLLCVSATEVGCIPMIKGLFLIDKPHEAVLLARSIADNGGGWSGLKLALFADRMQFELTPSDRVFLYAEASRLDGNSLSIARGLSKLDMEERLDEGMEALQKLRPGMPLDPHAFYPKRDLLYKLVYRGYVEVSVGGTLSDLTLHKAYGQSGVDSESIAKSFSYGQPISVPYVGVVEGGGVFDYLLAEYHGPNWLLHSSCLQLRVAPISAPTRQLPITTTAAVLANIASTALKTAIYDLQQNPQGNASDNDKSACAASWGVIASCY